MEEMEEIEENEEHLFDMANAETQPDKTLIRRELKFATFEYDEDDKSILIETRSEEPLTVGDGPLNPHPVNGRIHLNKVYSFALLRFVIRIAQRNWFRKLKR